MNWTKVFSLPEDELDEGVQSLPLDEDSLPGEQVPGLNGHEAMVPDFEPSPSMQRKKQRTKVDDLAIDLKGWSLTNVSSNIQSLFNNFNSIYRDLILTL